MQESQGTPEHGQGAPEQEGGDRAGTSPPPEQGDQATKPPGNPPVDEEALEQSREKLDQAGGGH